LETPQQPETEHIRYGFLPAPFAVCLAGLIADPHLAHRSFESIFARFPPPTIERAK